MDCLSDTSCADEAYFDDTRRHGEEVGERGGGKGFMSSRSVRGGDRLLYDTVFRLPDIVLVWNG